MFRIKEILKEKGSTINELAEQLNIDRITLSRQINCNPNPPTISTLQKIAKALSVEIYDLFERKSNTELTAFIEYKKDVYKAETLEQLKNIVGQLENKMLLEDPLLQ